VAGLRRRRRDQDAEDGADDNDAERGADDNDAERGAGDPSSRQPILDRGLKNTRGDVRPRSHPARNGAAHRRIRQHVQCIRAEVCGER
jgi:hypothetical protein